ncbi:MAG: glycosyltransferase family 39 protein [Fibromonadales bacterium]|nr:glycosyltransferase family 39 protein [Fibromonadales bacterium]
MKKIIRNPLLYLLPLLVLAGFWAFQKKAIISDITLAMNGVSYAETLPTKANIPGNTEFSVFFNFDLKKDASTTYKIIADDCILSIEINGKNFPQERIKNPCDFTYGSTLNFSEYMQEGLNKFEIRVKNHGGPGGLRFNHDSTGLSTVQFKHILFSILLLITAAVILLKLKFSATATFLVILGISIRLIYSSYTDMFDRVYDLHGHLEYIKIIADESRIPATGETWSSYHPPLYYLIGALIKKAFPGNYQVALVTFAMLISFVSIAFGVALLQNLNTRRRFLFLSGLLFVSWPGFVISSTRVGNDVPAYLGMFICIYYAQKWWENQTAKYMILASLGAAIGIMLKASGVAVAGVWVFIWIIGTLRTLKLAPVKTIIICLVMALAAVFASQSRMILAKNVYLTHETGNQALRVNNSLGNFIYFDSKEYLTVPYLNTYDDRGGRQYFLNFAIKSSLFGEYRVWSSEFGNNLALLIAFTTLFLLALSVVGLFAPNNNMFPIILFFFALFASLVGMKAMYPYSCLQDVRYIMPILLPLSVFITHGAQKIPYYPLRVTSYCVIIFFSLLSWIFIAGQAFSR